MVSQDSPHPPTDHSGEVRTECHDFLLDDTSGKKAASSAMETPATLPKQSMLAPTWKSLWKTPSVMIALFVLGGSILITIHCCVLTMTSKSMAGCCSTPRTVQNAEQQTNRRAQFCTSELCRSLIASSRPSLPSLSLWLFSPRLYSISLAPHEGTDGSSLQHRTAIQSNQQSLSACSA
jgi:hypothetical protein